MSAHARFEYAEDGRCRRMLGVMADITTLKQAELALRDAGQRKDEFLAMLAHELRNPLAPIRNAAYVLGRLEVDEPRVHWARELIERQVAHLTHLVDDLLDVSRIARGKVTLKMARIELAEVIRQACESAQSTIAAKGHRFEVHLPETPVMPGRRSGAPDPGSAEPAQQRREVHPRGRPDRIERDRGAAPRSRSGCATTAWA
jgi:signal transduction histidine kinase